MQSSTRRLNKSPVSIQTQSLALRALHMDGNRAKRKPLRWQAANHVCHCFDRASYWLLAIAFGWKPGLIVTEIQQCSDRPSKAAVRYNGLVLTTALI